MKNKFTLDNVPLPSVQVIRVIVLGGFVVAALASLWAGDILIRHALFLPAEGAQPVIRVFTMAAVLLASAGMVGVGFYLLYDTRNERSKNEP